MPDDGSNLIAETAGRVLRDMSTPDVINAAEKGTWPGPLWDQLDELGLPLTWVPEELGGVGAGIADGFEVLRATGAAPAPVPLAETLLAGLLLARAAIAVPPGPLSLALNGFRLGPDGCLSGRAAAVPFARHCGHLAVLADAKNGPAWALVAVADCALTPGADIAGQPCDAVEMTGVRPAALAAEGPGRDEAVALGAAARTMQIAGAMEHILNLSLTFAQDRVQFGRAIAKFQVIQHNLAELAGEVAAASAAADAAARALAVPGPVGDAARADIAAAKIRAGEAASTGAAIAHQVHGAIGFTYEHALHLSTRRLWVWRDSFGTEAEWAEVLGSMAIAAGPEALWAFVTGS